MIPSAVFQVTIPACVDGAELSGLLACSEFLGLWEQDSTLMIYWQGSQGGLVQQMQKALLQMDVAIEDLSGRIQPVRPQDWNAQWAAQVEPIRIGRRIAIRPSWQTMDVPEGGIEIILDPRQAFGTGHHATTHLLLEWLEEIVEWGGYRVLDVGTGSGILSMVALRLGALSAFGIDCDPVAIDCAKDYALTNGFTNSLNLHCGQIEDIVDKTFEVIVANIDRKTILEISPGFSRLRTYRTQLFLSGLLEEDEGDVSERLSRYGWVQKASRARDGWIALQFAVVPID